MELLRFDHSNITFAAADAFARIDMDAFKGDPTKQALWPANARFASLPPIADYENLYARVDLFGRVVRSAARRCWLDVSRDPHYVLYLLKSNGKCVATARWLRPEHHPLPQLPWYRRLWLQIVACAFRVVDFVSFLGIANPLDSKELASAYDFLIKELGIRKSPALCERLAALPAADLRDVSYPKEWCYHLNILAVQSDEQGKGYGKRVLLESQADATLAAKAPPGLGGPPKISVVAAPNAVNFYSRLGFRGKGVDVPRINVRWIFYFLNIDRGAGRAQSADCRLSSGSMHIGLGT